MSRALSLKLQLSSSAVILRVFAMTLLPGFAGVSPAAPSDRVTGPVDVSKVRAVPGNLHRLARPEFDQGAAAADMRMGFMLILFKPAAAQQSELDALLAAQQNPSSPLFHRWLSPEEFGHRFGLSAGDGAQVTAWLRSQGFTVNELARARNWVAFSGTAGQVSRSLHTSVHRFLVNGKMHFANTAEPSVPEALADVVSGFLGLNDFYPEPRVKPAVPEYTSGSYHYLAPDDFATIYDIAPLYQAGADGSGVSIAVVGESDILLSDIHTFRTRYNLPANDPKMTLVGATDPGYDEGAQFEANLDLEWAGAIAPQATLYYVYGQDAFAAIVSAVNTNIAQIVSSSYGACEVEMRPGYWRTIAQQANAQGITLIAASGDSGAAGCETGGYTPFASEGRMADWPAVMPEVTGVGGTEFVEGTGTYWTRTNAADFSSALSYIPETAWNESSSQGLAASGGGTSLFCAKPAWQSGVSPSDNARDVPDVAFSAAGHDAYLITYQGLTYAVNGTSASAPSMAGVVALLNQYQVVNKYQAAPGLGNINPQLYRLAQSAPSAFHDIQSGSNIVPCAQGSPDCITGSFGYKAGIGYDQATGLGSIDVNNLVTQWNTAANGVTVALTVDKTKATLNDTLLATATVFAVGASGTPSGTVQFSANGIPLGVATVTGSGGESQGALTFPLYLLGSGTFVVTAQYSGDAAFSSGGATAKVQVTIPSGQGAAIIPSWPEAVWPSPPDAQGLSWQTVLSLREVAGVPAIVTGFTIDGVSQTLAQYFPSPEIAAGSTLGTTIVFRGLAAPVARTFGFSGMDSTGRTWSRQVTVNYMPLAPGSVPTITAVPLVVAQNTGADPSCQWQVQLTIDEQTGFSLSLLDLMAGGIDLGGSIPSLFGTERLNGWGSLQGTLCFGGITPPVSNDIAVDVSGLVEDVSVFLVGPPANPFQIATDQAAISLVSAAANQPAQAVLAVNVPAQQPWTATILPANRTSGWLSASALSGTGPGQITLTASGTGFEPGAYRAAIVIQSPNAMPQYVNVPVMFVLGPGSTSIASIAGDTSTPGKAAPGIVITIAGSNLANSTDTAAGPPLPFSLDGVSAAVNGIAAPLWRCRQAR